jgi:hypothetical protein
MTPKHAFFCVLALIHLILVACGALGISWEKKGSPWPKVLQAIRESSGSDANHGYFAPGVGPNYRMTFILKDAKGRTWTDILEKTDYHEANLRLAGIVDVMVSSDDFADEYSAFAKSCAAKVLARHPSAVLVTVRVERDQTPSMAEWRAGKRVEWEKENDFTFTRKEAFSTDDDDEDDDDEEQ